MESVKKDLNKVNPAGTTVTLSSLNATLAQHMQYLKKQNAALESLTRAVQQLETTIKKVNRMDGVEIPLELRESLNTFVEYHINPKYYQNANYEMLTSAMRKKITAHQ
jgi:hypothetical protein